MSIGVEDAFKGGYERVVTPAGLQLAAILFVFTSLSGVVTVDIQRALSGVGPEGGTLDVLSGTLGPSLGLSLGVAVFAFLLLGLVSTVVRIIALRTFVNGDTEEIPRAYVRRNIAWVTLNAFIGGFVVAAIVSIGLVLLVVPGLFLLASLLLWEVFVAVEDESFVEGFRSSWELASGHRVPLLALGLVAFGLPSAVNIAVELLTSPLPDILRFGLGTAGSALANAFGLAILADLYTRLTGDDAETQL